MGKITLKLQSWHDSLTTQTAEFHLSRNILSANLFADVYDATWKRTTEGCVLFLTKTNVKSHKMEKRKTWMVRK